MNPSAIKFLALILPFFTIAMMMQDKNLKSPYLDICITIMLSTFIIIVAIFIN